MGNEGDETLSDQAQNAINVLLVTEPEKRATGKGKRALWVMKVMKPFQTKRRMPSMSY